jgi:hypothetical protein
VIVVSQIRTGAAPGAESNDPEPSHIEIARHTGRDLAILLSHMTLLALSLSPGPDPACAFARFAILTTRR